MLDDQNHSTAKFCVVRREPRGVSDEFKALFGEAHAPVRARITRLPDRSGMRRANQVPSSGGTRPDWRAIPVSFLLFTGRAFAAPPEMKRGMESKRRAGTVQRATLIALTLWGALSR